MIDVSDIIAGTKDLPECVRSGRFKVVKMSMELVRAALFPDTQNGRLFHAFVTGLPPGAVQYGTLYDKASDQLWMRFAHDSFPPSGGVVERLELTCHLKEVEEKRERRGFEFL